MTREEFENQWNRDFAEITALSGEPMPSYDEYTISERMLDDYTDIFRGYNSRDGNIKMPYDHPFFDENGKPLLKEKPCIRYILVGEARPPQKKPIYNNCQGDESNTYFYNVIHIGCIVYKGGRQKRIPTPWLNAPRLNWGCPPFKPCPINKVQTLLCLASKGVLLLDLFPYAISYSTKLRKILNKNGTTRSFWDDKTNPYNLQDRIQKIGNLLCNKWDLSLVAPCYISRHIINFPPIAVNPAGIHPAQFKTLTPNASRCKLGADYRKVAVSSAGAPTRNLINI